MLSVLRPDVFMLSVIMLNVVACFLLGLQRVSLLSPPPFLTQVHQELPWGGGGAATLSIMTFSIMTLSICLYVTLGICLYVTLSIMTLSITGTLHNNALHYAECQ
jgi:hypothetical protein